MKSVDSDPHNDELSIRARRYESCLIIIPIIRFSGMYCAYEMPCRGQQDAPNNGMPFWWSYPVAWPLTIANSLEDDLADGFDFHSYSSVNSPH